jgi:hypothetical protein
LPNAETKGIETGRQLADDYFKQKDLPKIIDWMEKRIRDMQAQYKLQAEEDLSREFAEFMQKREQQVKIESAAWATYRSAATIARRMNIVPGAEKEEDSLAQLVATSLARGIVRANGERKMEKTPWSSKCRDPSSPLHIEWVSIVTV